MFSVFKKEKQPKIFIYSGAGLSQESGLKTFRDSNGLWENHKIEDVCNYRTWYSNYDLVHNFYNQRRMQLEEVKPNVAHLMIAEIQAEFGIENCINVTTNVDDLLERADVKNVLHLHGNLTELKNLSNDKIENIGHEKFEINNKEKTHKPNVVFFNEICPQYDYLNLNKFKMEEGDIVVTIGMSFVVVDTYQIFSNYIRTVNININLDEKTNEAYKFDLCINKPATEIKENNKRYKEIKKMEKQFYIDNIENTIVKNSNIHGYGLFATKLIKKDTLLCILNGQIIKREEYSEFLKHSHFDKKMFIEKYNINEEYIAAMPFRTKYSYINHDEYTNIKSEVKNKQLYVYANEDIEEGIEIVDIYNLRNHIDVLGGFRI